MEPIRHANALVCLLAALAAVPAAAADIVRAAFDPLSDELVVDIVYLGTHPKHDFFLQWDRCYDNGTGSAGVAARLVDRHGDDRAEIEYRVRERFSLDTLACRPARVTLRLGRSSHQQVFVPAAPGRQ